MAERGFITPPPGLLPAASASKEPAGAEEKASDPAAASDTRSQIPAFFAAPPGAAPAIPSAAQIAPAPAAGASPVESATDRKPAQIVAPEGRVAAPPAAATQITELPGSASAPDSPASAPVPAVAPDAPARPPVAAPAAAPAPQETAGWTLEVDGEPFGVIPEILVLGRAPSMIEDGAVLLPVAGGGTVSKTHAVLRREGGSLTVEDLGSTNGTAVAVAGMRTLLQPRVPFRVEGDAELQIADARLQLRRL